MNDLVPGMFFANLELETTVAVLPALMTAFSPTVKVSIIVP
jgi:hypothetical protein